MNSLIDKYNIPGPRYTSYPTVPYWDESTFSAEKWTESVIRTFKETNAEEGISIYIHLPFVRRYVRSVHVINVLPNSTALKFHIWKAS